MVSFIIIKNIFIKYLLCASTVGGTGEKAVEYAIAILDFSVPLNPSPTEKSECLCLYADDLGF